MRSPRGAVWAEPNPAPPDDVERLPEIERPSGAASVSDRKGVFVPDYSA
jgi:hypothetical protein